MPESVPFYISAVFILTTFFTVGVFLYAAKRGSFSSRTTQVFNFLLPFWLIFQAVISLGGFYLQTDSFPPRLFLFALFPTILTIVLLFIFDRNFISKLSLKTLTWIHVARIPVEIVLLWLFQIKLVPQLMTFEGRNFDILAGITAPFVAWLAFRNGKINRTLLLIWNALAFLLLLNILVNAILSIPSPMQKFAFDQPNVGVLYFPFIWLPAVIVPIILFSHLASFWQLLKPSAVSKL